MSSWFVYIVECSDGTLYTGIAVDVAARVREHNAGTGAKYTKSRRPVNVVYQEKAKNRSAASKREYEIKHLTRRQKFTIIDNGLGD